MTTRSSSAGGSLPFVGGRPRFPHLRGNQRVSSVDSTPSSRPRRWRVFPHRIAHHAAVRRAAALRAVEVDHGVVGRRLLRREAVEGRQVLQVDCSATTTVFARRRDRRRRRWSRSRSRPRRRRPRSVRDGPLPSQALDLGARPDRASNVRRRRRAQAVLHLELEARHIISLVDERGKRRELGRRRRAVRPRARRGEAPRYASTAERRRVSALKGVSSTEKRRRAVVGAHAHEVAS